MENNKGVHMSETFLLFPVTTNKALAFQYYTNPSFSICIVLPIKEGEKRKTKKTKNIPRKLKQTYK